MNHFISLETQSPCLYIRPDSGWSFWTKQSCDEARSPSKVSRLLSSWGKVSALASCVLQTHFSCVWLFATPWTVAHQVPQSMGFSRQENWSELPCPPPGDLPDPGIEPVSFVFPALAGGFYTTSAVLGLPEQRITDEWLKQQKCILSQFWRLEIQDQGVSRACSLSRC